MVKRSGAGSLTEMVAFLQPVSGDDGYGGVQDGYAEAFRVSARLAPKLGSEPVIAGRLQGIQPYTITVRSSVQTRGVTPAWRAHNVRTGMTYNIKTNVNIDERNAWQELLVVASEAG